MRMRLAAAVAAAGLAAGGCSMFSEDSPAAAPDWAGSLSQADLDQAVTAATSQAQATYTAALQSLETDLERKHERDLRNLVAAHEAEISERERIATEKAEQLGVLAAHHEAELSDATTAHHEERMRLEDAHAETLQQMDELNGQMAEMEASYEWFIEFVGTTADCVEGDETGPPSSPECYTWEQPVRDLYRDRVMYPHEAQELVDEIIESEIVPRVRVQYGAAEYIEFVCGEAAGCAAFSDGTIHILGDKGEPPEAADGFTHLQGSRRTVLHETGHQIFYWLPKQPGLFGMFYDNGKPRADDEAVSGHATLLFRCVVADLYVEWLEWDIPQKDAVQRVCAQTRFVFTSEREDPDQAEPDTAEDEAAAAVAG